jgi:hypothetical protein
MKQQYGESDNNHPLSSNYGNSHSSNDQGPKHEYHNQSNHPSSNNHNVSPQQQEQLEQQRLHQQRLQEQMQNQDSVRIQQHRVARPDAPAAVQDRSTYESKPANYYAYPPQPSASSDSTDPEQLLPLKARLTKLVKFPCSIYGKSLLLVFSLEALLVIIMQIIVVVKYFVALRDSPVYDSNIEPYLDPNNPSRAIVAYLIVFVFAQLFQIVMAWDAVSLPILLSSFAFILFRLSACPRRVMIKMIHCVRLHTHPLLLSWLKTLLRTKWPLS